MGKKSYATVIDCDLQDPPEMIPKFLKKWEQGSKIVYGIRMQRQEGAVMNFLRSFYYSLISSITVSTASSALALDKLALDDTWLMISCLVILPP